MIMARVPLPSPGDPQVALRGACLGLPGALRPPRGPQGWVGPTRHDAVSTETIQESQALKSALLILFLLEMGRVANHRI